MEQVAWRPCPKIDVEHELERSPLSLTAVSRLVHEQTNLLVGRSCEPTLLAELSQNAPVARTTVAMLPERGSKRRMKRTTRMSVLADETTIQPSSPLTRAETATCLRRARDVARSQVASCNLRPTAPGGISPPSLVGAPLGAALLLGRKAG